MAKEVPQWLKDVAGIFTRIPQLIVKLISRKGLVLAIATWLAFEGRIDGITWAIAAAGVVGSAAWEKQRDAVKGDK